MSGRRVLITAGVSAVLFTALTALVVARNGPLLTFDATVSSAAWRAAVGHPAWRWLMTVVTNTGGPAVVTVAAVAAVAVLLEFRRWRDAVFVAVAMLGAAGIRLIVLNAVGRMRPVDRLAPAAGFSFPSGHTTGSATAALIAITLLWPLLRGLRRVVVVGAAGLWAVAVGVSRVALVVHWPTDVLGAWLLAVTVVVLALPVRGALGRAGPGTSGGDESGDGRGRPGRSEPVAPDGDESGGGDGRGRPASSEPVAPAGGEFDGGESRGPIGRSEPGPGDGDELGGGERRGPVGRSEPGAGDGDELGGGDGRGRAERDEQGEQAGEAAPVRSGSGTGQGLHTADDGAAADRE